MQEKNGFSIQEMNKKIHNLRSKLNKIYEEQGHTAEVVKISQELDRFILLIQKRLINE